MRHAISERRDGGHESLLGLGRSWPEGAASARVDDDRAARLFLSAQVGVGARGAVSMPGRVLLRRGAADFTQLAGVGLRGITREDRDEIWDTELVLVPRSKHARGPRLAERLDQVLMGSEFSDPERWGETTFRAGAQEVRDAVVASARLVLRSAGSTKSRLRTLLAGQLLGDLGLEGDEIWSCDLVMVPRQKYAGACFITARIDQVLTGDIFRDPSAWAEED